jgi:tetratricopeptide (TPR) repeat protein
MVAALVLGVDSPVRAEETDGKATSMRERVYEKLSRAQAAVEAENWAEALEMLEDVKGMRDLDAYEAAQLYTAYGYMYFGQGKYEESIRAYEQVLVQEGLPEALEASTRYTLAQLRFQMEDYEEAIDHLDRWLAAAANPGPEPFVLLAQAYYQLGQPQEAVQAVVRAIGIAEERGQPSRESWYALLRALYHESGDYPKLLEVLEVLVTRFPKKEYWIHLSATYGELGDSERQLATYEAAFAQGYLETGRDLLFLAQLFLQAEIPYRAAVVLEKGLEDGLVEGTAANWRLLSQAWTLAHEPAEAIEALTKAAELSDDGELDARLAQSYANLDDWENAVAAARIALRRGVRDPHDLRILMGIALFELERYDEAKSVFQEAQKSAQAREAASRWIAHIEREEERLRELQGALR